MKKLLLSLAIVGCAVVSAFAQKSSEGGKWNVGIEAGLPVGDASNVSNFAIGASVKYEQPIADQTFVTISAGYSRFLYKSDVKDALREAGINKSGEGFVPIKAGLKYYFMCNAGFFAEGQLGVAISTESGGGTAFAYSPGVGYTVDGGFEVGVRYEGWSHDGTLSQMGLRLGYRF